GRGKSGNQSFFDGHHDGGFCASALDAAYFDLSLGGFLERSDVEELGALERMKFGGVNFDFAEGCQRLWPFQGSPSRNGIGPGFNRIVEAKRRCGKEIR